MVKSITLTASMRSNLNSLKNISKQMNTTQERLSTGKKVNSAIDNASSYYQARALTNRASDLDALLDAMGQGIQTIQAATQGLTSGVSFLEQASAIATEALAATKIPSKEWFEAQVGENGAVVTTAQELKDAINSGKETICVYGKIDYLDNGILKLKTGQKLVGTEYYTGYTGTERFSSITSNATYTILTNSNTVVSDLDIIQKDNGVRPIHSNVLYIQQNTNVTLNNLNLSSDAANFIIQAINSDNLYLTGHISMQQSGSVSHALWMYNNSTTQSNITIDAEISSNIKDSLICLREADKGWKSNIHLLVKSGSILRNENNIIFKLGNDDGVYDNSITLEEGVSVQFGNKELSTKEKILYQSGKNVLYYFFSDLENDSRYKAHEISTQAEARKEDQDRQYKYLLNQYNKAFEQYDTLIEDSSYQGVNLLKNEKLDVIFNETRNNKLTVQGQDMSSAALGLTKAEWTTQGDIANSIQELLAAVNKIRTFQSELGNNYSIIQTRQNFTEALTDVLETGADNLVLADMNEESANYLALQTRQQLATNALSLAANSAQSILALFG